MSRLTDQQKQVVDLLHDHHGYGRRRISQETGLTEKQVRYYLENRDHHLTVDENPFDFVDNVIMGAFPLKAYVWDLETTDFMADIGTLGVASFLDLSNGDIHTRTREDFAGGVWKDPEEGLALWTRRKCEEADVLIGHNSLAFDKNFLNGVLARHGHEGIPKRIHWDTYQIARNGGKFKARYSLKNLADFFRLPEPKDEPSKHDWRLFIAGDSDAIARIVERCEADVRVTGMLFNRLRPYLMTWKGQ
jgi:hypothetical protein